MLFVTWYFAISQQYAIMYVTHVSVSKMTISAKPSWQQQLATPTSPTIPDRSSGDSATETQVGAAVLALTYTHPEPAASRTPTPTNLPFLQRENTLMR